jgi:NAD-dependent dihydropyrimidine dehydrogenase PreA subunit
MKRSIIQIDRELCDGCGLCTTACAEGALALDGSGKAVIVRETYCDGLGACLPVCPTGALTVIEREAPAYDETAAERHVLSIRGPEAAAMVHRRASPNPASGGAPGSPSAASASKADPGFTCPGSLSRSLSPSRAEGPAPGTVGEGKPSRLGQWPVQLALISPEAPYFRDCDFLLAADCAAYALGSFHELLLDGRRLAIACPKLDSSEGYAEKLAELLRRNAPRSLTVALMDVPCCGGLLRMLRRALEESGLDIPMSVAVLGMDGSLEWAQGGPGRPS